MADCPDYVEEWFQHLVSNSGLQMNPSDESEAKFVCNNCLGLAYLPYKTNCNHLFCTECYQILLNNGRKCLIDNRVIQDIEVSLKLKNQILNMKLPCPYKAHGCSKFICIQTAWEHVKECAKNYAVIDCPWKCGGKVQMNQLNTHFKTDCHRHPEKSSQIVSNSMQLDGQLAKQTASQQRFRSKTPVVNMFKTLNMSPGYATQSNSPQQKPNGIKTITFTWPILHYLQVKHKEMSGEIRHSDSELFSHRDLAYQFKIRVFLNGSGYGKGTHVSVFIGVNRGFNRSSSFVHPHKLTLKILNQNKASNEIQMDIKKSLQYDANKSAFQENKDKTIFEFYGFKKYCEQNKAEHRDYLINETLIFEVVKELI